MTGQSILDVLPIDVIELVIRELQRSKNYQHEHLCALRLVCRTINELVEPRIFSSVVIRFIRDDPEKQKRLPAFFSSLASGASPYVRWAKELHLKQFIRVQSTIPSWSSWKGKARELMLACQKEWLTPAIESLIQVERVQFRADSSDEPYHEALCAVANLPRLRDLSITFFFTAHSAFDDLSFPKFSSISNFHMQGLRMKPTVLEGLKGLIARSPHLKELALDVPSADFDLQEAHMFDFDSLFEDVPPASDSPKLNKLTISAQGLNLSPSRTPFLRSLTSLVILGDSDRVQPLFWKVLQDSRIHLQELRLTPLRQPAVDYLLSYSGLRVFSLEWPRANVRLEGVEEMGRQFFLAILPRHRATIQSIYSGHSQLGQWTITQSYLDEGVYLCKNLRILDLIYYFPSPNEERTLPVIPLANLLGEISEKLPQLQVLRLEYTRKFQGGFYCGEECNEYYQLIDRVFAHHIVKSPAFWSKRQPQFVLSAAGTRFISTSVTTDESDPGLENGSGQYYRFKPLNDSDYLDLRLDEEVEDQDAEDRVSLFD